MLTQLQAEAPADFASALRSHGFRSFDRGRITTVQVNVGKLCNQACHHCHVDAGPKRTEIMRQATARRILHLLERSPGIETVDITGGAPELNPNFTELVTVSRGSGRRVIDRCNLTVIFESGYEYLPEFLARNEVEITASLPCYTAANVDSQRGRGVFDKSIKALQLLNSFGYGMRESRLILNLVYNPLGPTLPPSQQRLEADYKAHLGTNFSIEFNRLLTITNMPISRFAETLQRSGASLAYSRLLAENFNPQTVEGVMCRSLVSVSYDGGLYDCDFNQMLDLRVPSRRNIWDIEFFSDLENQPITTGSHCFGCTAGSGSSCGGQLE